MQNTFYNSFDLERLDQEKEVEEYRSVFQIDRDRVMHTPTFRSLQSKTQVFWSGEYDFYRTRLTHSLEVSQIGRSICHWLKQQSSLLSDDFYIDADLVEAACLAHDIGHPPFGHAGERSLNQLMSAVGGFEGNAQTLRLLTERIFTTSQRGMNPSRAFVDSVLKYKTLWSERVRLGGKPPKNHFLYDHQSKYVDWVLGDRDFPIEYPPGDTRDGFRSVECQIMDWADDTAYSLNDIADSVRAGFLTIEKVEQWAEKHAYVLDEEPALKELLLAIRKGKVEVMMGRKIGRFIKAVELKECNNFMSATSNRYKYELVIAEECLSELKIFKKLAFDVVFLSPELNQLEYKGDYLLRKVWQVLDQCYVSEELTGFNLLPAAIAQEFKDADRRERKLRILCDTLASLTDGSATRLYKRLTVPDFGSIGDLI